VIVYVAWHIPGPFGQTASKTVTDSSSSVTLPSAPVKVTWRISEVYWGLGGAVMIGWPPLQLGPGQNVIVVGKVTVVVAAVGQTE
jgi:hypothetical protein